MAQHGSEQSKVRIGYLVPEFPGQTHVMFWREVQKLEQLGFQLDIVSTRRPSFGGGTHKWSREAESRTVYLYPIGLASVLRTLWAVFTTDWLLLRAAVNAVRTSERGGHGKGRLAVAAFLGVFVRQLASIRGWGHLHVHSCGYSADIARFSRLLGGPPYSLTLHGPLSDYGLDQGEKWSGAAFGVVITEQLAKQLQEVVGTHIPPDLAVCGMGVDTAKFRNGQYRPWNGRGVPQIFSCGRLNPAKGHIDLVEAVAIVRRNGIPVTCVIAGEDEAGGKGYRLTLEARIDELGLEDCVHLLGAVAEEDVIEQLSAAHVFVLASIQEPLGVAIMEAMCAGVPVVATDAGGVPQLVTHEENGLLVMPNCPEAVAAAVERVLCHQSLALKLSRAARASAQARARLPSSADVLVDMLSRGKVV